MSDKFTLTKNANELEKICERLNDPSQKEIIGDVILNSDNHIYLDLLQGKDNLTRYISNSVQILYHDESNLSVGSAPFSKQGTFNAGLLEVGDSEWYVEGWDDNQHVYTGLAVNVSNLNQGKVRIYLLGTEKGDHDVI